MNYNRIKNLYKREMTEIVRNRGLLLSLLFLPLVIYPMILIYSLEIGASHQEKVARQKSSVCISGMSRLPELKMILESDPKLALRETETAPAIDSRCNLTLTVEETEDFFGGEGEAEKYNLTLRYDSTDERSSQALERVGGILRDYRQELVYRNLESHGLSTEILNPVVISTVNQATNKKIAGHLLGMVLPFMLLTFIMAGTIQVAVDITAGEKERRTIQTLLLTPISRSEILVGKMLAILTTSLCAMVVNFLSIALTISFISGASEIIRGYTISPAAFTLAIAASVPLLILMSSLFLCLGMMARNQIEASIYNMPVMLLVIIPILYTMNGNFEDQTYMYLVPVANTAIAIKAIFMGTVTLKILALTCLSNLLYAAAITAVTAKLFQYEDIAFGGITDIIFQKPKKRQLGMWDSLLMYGVCLIIYFFLGSRLQQKNLYMGLIFSQILFLLLPVLAVSAKKGLSLAKTFRFRKTAVYYYLMAPILGVAALLTANLAASLLSGIIQTPESVASATENMVRFTTLPQGILVFFTVAITPAVIEELFFRGYFMRGMERGLKGFWLCFATGLAFALFHMNAYNLAALTIMGTVISGLALLSGSIYPAMLMHMTINGIQVLSEHFQWNPESHMTWLTVLSVLILILFFLKPVRPGRKFPVKRRKQKRG